MADSDINLETILEQLEFNYGGVLQELARLHDTVVEQMEVLKTAGVKIRRKSTTYATGTVLVCVGKNNGNKRLKCKSGGTTSDATWTESTYNNLVIGNTYSDGSVVWEVMEEAYTSGSIVESALNASHAEIADFASSASSAGYAESAGYIGPFQVVNLGTATSSGIESSGGPVVTSTGINYEVRDTTRVWATSTAGVIVNGEFAIPVPYASGFLPDGRTLYLYGSSGTDGSSFDYGYLINSETKKNEFITALAHNEGGQVLQIQFGDIVTPWPGNEDVYQGPYKVEADQTPDSNGNVHVKIYDPTAPVAGTPAVPQWAGKIFAGEQYHQAPYKTGTLNNGDYLYLVGDSKNGDVVLSYTAYIPQVTSDGEPSGGQLTITSAGFYVRLAKNEGGKLVQIQHGDITVPPWKVVSAGHTDSANYADSAGYAANVEYNGPFKVSATSVDTSTHTANVKIYDPTDNSTPAKAGRVFDGSNLWLISSKSLSSIQDGGYVYLNGNYGSSPSLSNVAGSNNASQFSIKIAKNIGGNIYQLQYGDVYSIPWNTTSAIHASTADYAEYHGPFHITFGGKGTTYYTDVEVKDDLRNSVEDSSWAGAVIIGPSTYKVPSVSFSSMAGWAYVYLLGTFTSGVPDFLISQGLSLPVLTENQFLAILGRGQGVNKFIQTQFGDIVQPVLGGTGSIILTSEYEGPFKVKADSVNPSTLAVDVTIYDPTDPSTNPYYAGTVFDGSTAHLMESDTLTDIANGGFVYLNGTSGATTSIRFSDSAGTNNDSSFSIRIAQNSGGEIVQIQHGDVYSIPWNTLHANEAEHAIEADSATIANYASSADYAGPFHAIAGGTNGTTLNNIQIQDDTRASNIGGYVVVGSNIYSANSAANITLSSGYKLYLVGTSSNGSITLDYSSTNTAPTPATNTFWTQLAYNAGGKLIQTQFGDITQPVAGVTKIEVTGATVIPAAGTGDVRIIIPQAPVAGNILPVDWQAVTTLYPTKVFGQGKYTTDPNYDDTVSEPEYIKLPPSGPQFYGGIVVGWIIAPQNAGIGSEPSYSYEMKIQQLNSEITIPLLQPEITTVVDSAYEANPTSVGECMTPRKSYVYLCIPPGTYFHLVEIGSNGNYQLEFYPYVQPS